MKLPKNIKIKPNWLGKNTVQAIFPNIYFSKWAYKKLASGDKLFIAALIHEQEHFKRQKEFGVIYWILKYVFSPKFRFEEELQADISRINYLKSKGIALDTERRAKELSSWIYLWCVPYGEAKKRLGSL